MRVSPSVIRRDAWTHLAGLSLAVLAALNLGCAPAPEQRFHDSTYSLSADDAEEPLAIPSPPPIVVNCRYPGCAPGVSSQDELTLEATASGPYLKRWALGIGSLPDDVSAVIAVDGEARKLPAAMVLLGSRARLLGLRPLLNGGPIRRLPVSVVLDAEALRGLRQGQARYPDDELRLVLQVRQLLGEHEIDRWRMVYDFTTLVATTTPSHEPRGDYIVLDGYRPDSSPIVLLAHGTPEQRTTAVYHDKSTIAIENLSETAQHVEVAVWAYSQQPVLYRRPRLTADVDRIVAKAPGIVEFTPNLWLPDGAPAKGVSWQGLAQCDYAVANRLLQINRVGVRLRFQESPTSGQEEETVMAFCDHLSQLKRKRVLVGQSVNIYYLDADDVVSRTCCSHGFPEALFITKSALPSTLLHELGHSFGLGHSEKNRAVMQPDALMRSTLTLPEVYLAIFGEDSSLNAWGLRAGSSRCGHECPGRCTAEAQVEWNAHCVSPQASFSEEVDAGPKPTAVEHLLMALGSEELTAETAQAVYSDGLATIPGVVPFLKRVAEEGARSDYVTAALERVWSPLGDECPLSRVEFVRVYRPRVSYNSRFAAANLLSAVQTEEARAALRDAARSAPKDLRDHIIGLLRR